MKIDESPFQSTHGRVPAPDEYGNYVFAKAPPSDTIQLPEDEILVSFLPYDAAQEEAARIARSRRWCQDVIYLVTSMSLPQRKPQSEGDGVSGA